MAHDYTIKDIRKGREWSNAYGRFQSYTLSLQGIGEPVSLNKAVPVKYEPSVGDVLYGNIDETGDFLKFKTEKRPDDEAQPALLPKDDPSPNNTTNYWDDKNAHIKAQWALGQAVQLQNALAIGKKDASLLSSNNVEETAKWFYGAVDRIVGLKVDAPIKEQSIEEVVVQKQADRDAKVVKSFNDGTPVPDEVYDFDKEEPINLDDIPF